MKGFLQEIIQTLENYGVAVNVLIAGLSGGFIRVRALMKKEKLSRWQILAELVSALICSHYVGDALVYVVPDTFKFTDSFLYFISGYAGMILVDFIIKKTVR